ncbi:hypothetical protein BZL43_15820 [Pseudomonas sp. PICF141]|nr:hypothetical protein BZL43_15820 [Pseudomonas sp. PICF141]
MVIEDAFAGKPRSYGIMIVPTFCVGMQPWTLHCDAERHGIHCHAERGNDQVQGIGVMLQTAIGAVIGAWCS